MINAVHDYMQDKFLTLHCIVINQSYFANNSDPKSDLKRRKFVSHDTKDRVLLSDLLQTVKQKDDIIFSLKNEINFLEKILHSLPGNVYWKNQDGILLGCNNNLAKILGYTSPKEITGKTNKELTSQAIGTLIDHTDQAVLSEGKEQHIEETGFNFNRQTATYLSRKKPLFDENNNIIGILGISFDITDRKKMEEDLKIAKEKAEISSKAKSRFLAIVNHELRTPIACIIGLINLFRSSLLSGLETASLAEDIDKSAQYLLKLTNNVLDFSKLESGKYTTQLQSFYLSDLAREVHHLLKPLADSKQLHFSYSLDEDYSIYCDQQILRQILINIAGNAIKFTDKGKVTLEFHTQLLEENKIQFKITVEDTGVGIPADKLSLIFDPFQQLQETYSRQTSLQGTGLGLAIVKQFAELLGFKIEVSSELGVGSLFSIIGELEIATTHFQDSNKAPTTITDTSTLYLPDILNKQPHILLIEDDPMIQFIQTKVLNTLGCTVDVYSHGKEAIRKLSTHDIALIDINLPDMNGFEVIKTIRELENYRNFPIIALTVYTSEEEKTNCLNAGANDFISKPVTQEKLANTLLKYLKK